MNATLREIDSWIAEATDPKRTLEERRDAALEACAGIRRQGLKIAELLAGSTSLARLDMPTRRRCI